MGIFEIIGEFINPGTVGKVYLNDDDYNIRQKLIPIRFIVSLIIIGLIEYLLIFQTNSDNDSAHILKVNIGLFIYLLISLFINIKPDYDNLGWVPFLINNPFRFSDNINRFLMILNFFLTPGKFISKSIVGFFRYLKDKNVT
jgi:hypothetical protein